MKTIILFATLTVLTFLGAACSKGSAASGSAPAKAPAASTGENASRPAIASKTPEDWLVVQDDYILVVDDLSRKMQSARQAFMMKDPAKAAADIRATTDLLSKETSDASLGEKETIDVAMSQLSTLAADLDSGKTVEMKRFDAAIAAAHHADLSRNWVVLDESTWYPYIEEPDRHFQIAHHSFVSKDYETTAQEIRKGEAFVKLEAGRATGDAKNSLNASAQELEKLAGDVQKGTVKDLGEVDNSFQRADSALAQSHQIKAKETWAKKETVRAGYEIKAGALLLEQSAGWAGGEASSGVSAVVTDTRLLGGKLTAGSEYAVEEVGKGIDDLGKAISDLDRKASSK